MSADLPERQKTITIWTSFTSNIESLVSELIKVQPTAQEKSVKGKTDGRYRKKLYKFTTIWVRMHLWSSTNKDGWYKTAQLPKIPILSIWLHMTSKRKRKVENFLLHGKYFLPQRNKPVPRKDSCRQVVKEEVKWKSDEGRRGLLRRESARQLWRNRRGIPVDETKGENVKRKQVVNWVAEQETYGLHKPVKRCFAWRNIYSRGIDYLWQADLVDISHLVEKNDGYRYLLIVIDLFSKYTWEKNWKRKTVKASRKLSTKYSSLANLRSYRRTRVKSF